jgi:hypothetical protein
MLSAPIPLASQYGADWFLNQPRKLITNNTAEGGLKELVTTSIVRLGKLSFFPPKLAHIHGTMTIFSCT